MLKELRRRISALPIHAVLGLVVATLVAWPTPGAANPFVEPWTNSFTHPAGFQIGLFSRTYALSNTGATLEPNEPTEGGLLTRSIWGRLTPTANYRVVIHTIGSEVDTVLAVYTGSAVNALTRVAGNHTFPVPGLTPSRSLVQFDAVAGVTYSIQIGSVGGAQGDISVNVFQLPAGGGLSAFFALVEGSLAVNGKDYACTTTTCFAPTFVVHNSTGQPLEVVSSTSFGPLFDAPAPLVLGPGAAAGAAFHSNANPDFLTTRTQTGQFVFSGRVSGAEVSRATYPGTVLVRGSALETTIVAAVLPTARAGGLNQVLTAFATLINVGSQPAIGCIVRSQSFSRFNVTFQETDPLTNVPVGAPATPVDIAPGARKTFVFSVASHGSELGDPEFSGPLLFTCANAFGASQNLANTFAVTALGTLAAADMISIGATPSGDGILDVPPAIGGAFGVATVNIGASATVRARPVYVHPFGEDDPAKQFSSFICETDAASNCVTALAPSVQFTATPNVPHTFAVFVQRPAVDPGFDPGQRRIFVKFEVLSPPNFFGSNPIPLLVGSTSVAPRAQ